MLLSNLDLLATAPGGVARLRELILTLAVQGKLVPQDPADEPAGVLLQKIRAEKDRLIAEGKIKRDKPLAEIGEEEKPFELPQGWEWASLATVGVINPRNDAPDETLASFVQMSSIPVEFSAVHISEPRPWKDIKSGFTQFAEGDVGVAKITPCFENGKSTVFQNLSNGIGAGTTELHIVRPLGGIERRYVLLFLKTPAFLKEGEAVMTGSAGQKRLPRSYFECKPFPLPPLAEQSRIVTRVEALMRLCDALEAKGQLEAAQNAQLVSTLLGTLTASTTPDELADHWQRVAQHFDLLLDRPEAIDALEQTLLQLAVRGLLVPQDPQDEPASQLLVRLRRDRATWLATRASTDSECRATIKKLRDLPDADNPFSIPSGWQFVRLLDCCRLLVDCHNKTAPYAAAGIPIIRTSNIRDGRFRMDDLRYVTEETYDFWSRRCPPEPGDIMFTREAPMGEAAIIPPGAKYCLGQRTMLVRPMHEFIDKEYLLLALTEPHLLERAAPSAIGSTVKHLRVGDVEGLTIPLPPLAEQSRIVTRVTALRRLCADLRQRLAERQSVQARLAQALVASVA